MADNASLSIIIQILWLAYCVQCHGLCLDDQSVCSIVCIIVLGPVPPPPPSDSTPLQPHKEFLTTICIIHVRVGTRMHMLLHVIAGFESKF